MRRWHGTFLSSIVSYEIKNLFKFFSVHKDVCTQNRIVTNSTSKSKDKNNCTVDRVTPEIRQKTIVLIHLPQSTHSVETFRLTGSGTP